MQPPATDELVLVSGTPPIRATKLRYFEDSTFKARILPPPTLASGDYVDRPAARADVWADSVRNTDARLGAGEDNVDGGAVGGLEQARQPGQEIDPPLTPDPVTTDPLGLGADDDDAVAYSQAMDQARALGTARSVYGIEAGAPASHGHRPDDLQLDF